MYSVTRYSVSRGVSRITTSVHYYSKCLSTLKVDVIGNHLEACTVHDQRRSRCSQVANNNQYSYFYHPGSVPLRNQTLGQLLGEAVSKWPTQESVVSHHQKIRLTFSDLLRRVDKFAAGLKKLGLKKGDKLGIFGPNDIEWIITFFSAARLGLVTVAINSAYQPNELAYCIQKVGVKAIVSPVEFKKRNYADMLLNVKKLCPTLEHIIIWSKDHIAGTRRYDDVESLASRIEVEGVAAEQDNVSCYDPCNIQFTSGTTGKPKATLLSHRSLVNNVAQAVRRNEFQPGQKICTNVPFFHAFGILLGQISILHAGCTTVLEGRSFNPVKSLEVMAEEKCDITYGTPTMWINLIDAQQRLSLPIQPRIGVTGGAPASVELFRRIRDILGIDNMKSIYGLTETTGIAFQNLPGDDRKLMEETVGHVSDHAEVMVVDETGKPVPFGSPGELWVRGYHTMLCYFNDEENTRKTITEDGWLKTGDQFVLQPNGYGQVIGRLKDMIIYGGENIFPKEIEDHLLTHPNIAETHVIGAYDEVYGEEVCACVRLRQGTSLTKEELQAFCKGQIAHFKIPRYVIFMDEYPKTVSGKIQKARLREELERKGVIPCRPK
ncbi:hypothetical protein KPH14_012049 [Odynerus spinipes]|uniref:Medium-chain acyl-CoA ligase ACSF2, mitochondrial n=1 Tax=Odynerus spinipes TaxID=1348599 RepID=A0AAD9VU06_9HYME|nr:hypothetical protein KPH14_012049 [Odynerus spinipes]